MWTNQFPNYSLQPEGKGEVGEQRVSWPELQLLLVRDSGLDLLPLTFSRLPSLCLGWGWGVAPEPSLPLKGEGCGGPRTEKPRLQDLV